MKKLFSIRNSLIIIFIFFLSIIIATFIENKYSSDSAFQIIYSSIFFETLAYIIIIALLSNIIFFKMYKKEKLPALFIHMSVILIITGAIITKHYSFQGEIYISANEIKDTLYSNNYYMQIEASKGEEKVSFKEIGNSEFKGQFNIFDKPLILTKKYYEKHIIQNIIQNEKGKGVISFEIIDNKKRVSHLFDRYGKLKLENLEITFNKEPTNKDEPYFQIVADESKMIHFISNASVFTNYNEELKKDTIIEFHPGIIYTINGINLLADEITTLGSVITKRDEEEKGLSALFIDMEYNYNLSKEIILHEKDNHYTSYSNSIFLEDTIIDINWGKLKTKLPFKIRLNEFAVIKYPGSDIVSSYESDVSLIDTKTNISTNHKIKINEPLVFGNYSIYQTKNQAYNGTVFSINYNPAKWIIYIAYVFLTFGLISNLFNKNSRFSYLSKKK